MSFILKIISFIGLGLTVLPSLFVAAAIITPELNKLLMIGGMLLWFSTAPFWINKKTQAESTL